MSGLSFETLQALELEPAELVAVGGPFVSSFLGFPYQLHESLDELPRDGRDLVVFVGKKDRLDAMRELCDYTGRVVAAFGPGDAGVAPAYLPGNRRKLPESVVALFSPNNQLRDERSVSVPLGVRAENLPALRLERKAQAARHERLCYANFTVNESEYPSGRGGCPHVRARLAEQLATTSWMTVDISERRRKDKRDLLRYYGEMACHKFAVSPQGRGIDSYRTWEALYLGVVPIVMRSPAMAAFERLPILFTDDYGELSESYLEQRWQEIASGSFQIERMLKSWYRHRFLQAISLLERPRFVCLWEGGSDAGTTVASAMRSARLLGGAVHDAPQSSFTADGEGLF